ncbi:hypothetical protein BDZ85DRAFT_255790 [Elsinoe ampelina]|uniref:Cyanovirin-N domain-containing protein n=1 Tax=Elsinoe ampelina TaxID=302913 RepID=A0A6A6GLI8_9PEZI|nr:hypothetical protein BDZ85DRAFT_255790 [Elsinoe ampelina]
MKLLNLAVLPAIFGGSLARMHDFCACQFYHGSRISPTATSLVAMDCSTGYEYSNSNGLYWIPGNGVKYQGRYLKATSGGRIDGDTFHNACKRNGGGESYCFNCSLRQYNNDGTILCNRHDEG